MKDYRFLIENTIRNMDSKISDFWLMEGVAEFAKQFPKMPEEKLRKLLALDPTYKGGEQVGKYGNWIVRLFYNNIKNRENNINYRLFLSQNPNGINPKTGKPIEAPVDLPATPWEDAEKIPGLLKQYEVLKNKIKKPITEFKDLPSLYGEIQKYVEQDVPMNKKALERYNVFKECEKKGLEKIYEDNHWLIGIPTTLESSVPFGQFTNWCTTSAHGQYYHQYLKQYGGEYYILLNKENGDLFQFHFESEQFMDEKDSRINMENFTNEYPNLAKFLYEYKFEKYPIDKNGNEEKKKLEKENKLVDIFEETKKTFDEKWEKPDGFNRSTFYYHYVKDLRVEGDKIFGQMDIDNLSNIIYNDNERDSLSNEAVCQILTGEDAFWYDYSDYSISDYNYYDSDWNEIAEKYGIENVYDWNKLVRIYDDEDDEDSEYISNNILKTLFKNDYARSVTSVRSQLMRNGIIDSDGIILQPEELNKLLPEERKVENISEEQKEQIREIIKDDFFDSPGLLPFMNNCKRSGTEQESEKDVMSDLKEELPLTGTNIYQGAKGVEAEFSITKDDLFKIYYMIHNTIFENVPSYNDKLKKKNLPEKQLELFKIPPMAENWWVNWTSDDEDEDYNRYYNGEDEDWLYLWRVINGKCDMDDGDYGAFAIDEPYYGWDGFDEEYMKDGFEFVAKKIATILGKELPKDEVK